MNARRPAIAIALAVVALTGTACSGEPVFRTCDEAIAAGAAPLAKGDAGYRTALDRDGDGVACDA